MYIRTIQQQYIFRDEPDITWEANEIMKDQQNEKKVVKVVKEEEKKETLCWALLELQSSKR